jgi:tetratricopeptide (TPR) repeat protein
VLGSGRLLHDWDFARARREPERGVQLSPSNPTALNHYAWYLLAVGRTEESLALTERLLSVAPLDPFYCQVRVRNFFWARQYERALEGAERLREEDPDFVSLEVGGIYVMMGRFEERYREHVAFDVRCGAPCDWSRQAWERG